jgi:hypothetical protein
VSREALSLEISNLVSRVVRGESIDMAQTGAALAAKYPDLGMSGALIGQAIERAVGMVGMIRSAPLPTKRRSRAAEMVVAPVCEPALSNGHAVCEPPVEDERKPRKPGVEHAVAAMLPMAQPIDDNLAAAIDAEIGDLVSGQRNEPKPAERQAASNAHPSLTGNEPSPTPAMMAQVAGGSNPPKRGTEHGSIISSFRRVLFRT